MTTINIGADHAGYKLKEHLVNYLAKNGYTVNDFGAHKLDKNDDYPDYAEAVGKATQKKGLGILICGSAEGVSIAANKIRGIRAVAVWNTTNAKLSKQHNNANILCLSGWQLTTKEAERIALTWIKTPFSNAPRHKRRIAKIKRMEK